MTNPIQPIPTGHPTVSPYLCVDGAAEAIDFYTTLLGATERMRMGGPGGMVGHAELAPREVVVLRTISTKVQFIHILPRRGAERPQAPGAFLFISDPRRLCGFESSHSSYGTFSKW